MNRREYLRLAAGLPAAGLIAGCTGGNATAGPTETVVIGVDEGGAAEPPATEADAQTLEIRAAEFERLDANEFVVRGAVRNVGDQPIEHLELDVRLYEASEQDSGYFDRALREREFQYLAAGQEWDFRIRFDDVEIPRVEYFSISATATLATPTP